jgi:hypothetical protein
VTDQTSADAVKAALAEPFHPRELKFKPQVVKDNRALGVAYVDVRVVQERLDGVLGVDGWQDEYEVLPDNTVLCRLRCKVAGEWLTKMDVGAPSEQPDGGDRMKAAFSDALKRAAVKFGVGRYLYRLGGWWLDFDQKKRQFTQVPQLPAGALPTAMRAGPAGKPLPAPADAPKQLPAAAGADIDPSELTPDALLFKLHTLITRKSKAQTWKAALLYFGASIPEGWEEPENDDDVRSIGEWLPLIVAKKIEAAFANGRPRGR